MSLLTEFQAQPGQTQQKIRIEKPVQHVEIRRWAPLALLLAGLASGFPEQVDAEITHPVRKRVRPANEIPLGHMAFFAQHGRGPILETAPSRALEVGGLGNLPADTAKADMFCVVAKYYVNDQGPLDLEANDHFFITLSNLIPNAHYEVWAPEQQVVASEGNRYFEYESAVILASDREKVINTIGAQALIIPNAPDKIERIVLKAVDGAETELYLHELQSVQTDVNPFTNVLCVRSNALGGNQSFYQNSAEADFLLIMLQSQSPATYGQQVFQSVQLDTVLGNEVRYTTISVRDRVG